MEEDDQANLECPVCKEHYNTGLRTPKMMPCLHTVCSSCLHDLTSAKPTSPENILNKPMCTPPAVVSTNQEVEVAYDEVVEHLEVGSFPPLPTPPQPLIHHRIAGPNATAISNLANILQGNPHPHLRRLSVPETPQVEETPPPLPVRGYRITPPPRRSKTLTGLIPPPLTLSEKEPEIPRNIAFQCPVCRTLNDSSKLQTNRYVVAHIRDLQRLSKTNEPMSPMISSPRPVGPTDSGGTIFTPERYWCTTCARPCTSECSAHTYQPLEEYAQGVRAYLNGIVTDIEQRSIQHSNSLDHTDASFKYVFQIFNKASRHLWKMNQSTQELKEKLTNIKNDLSFNSDPTRVLQEALVLTSKVESIRTLNEQLTKLENGVNSDDIFIWRQNNKLYVSTKEPDQTIIITVNDSNSRREQDVLDQLSESSTL